MQANITLKKLKFNEENKVIDLIYQDEELRRTFVGDKNTRSRLANSCYAALIEKDRKTIGFIMIVNNPRTNINEIDMGILTGYRNQGYGTKALGILKNIIIQNDLEVEIQTKKQNISAITSVVYNGFTLVRQDQNHYYYSLPKGINREKVKRKDD